MGKEIAKLLTPTELPDLHKAKPGIDDLDGDTYWTPETEGESKRVFFQVIDERTYEDKSGNTIKLPCAIMVEQKPDGTLEKIRNGSKRLVAKLEQAVDDEIITFNTPLLITYKGKQKNKGNSFFHDVWGIHKLDV